jgi:hypothetical protein
MAAAPLVLAGDASTPAATGAPDARADDDAGALTGGCRGAGGAEA